MSQLPLLFFDLETTGLDKDNHTILEIAIVKTNWEGEVLSTFETKIKPSPADIIKAHPKALEINGFTEEDWRNAPPPEDVLDAIQAQFEGKHIIVGQNIAGFDIPFLTVFFEKHNRKLKMSRRSLDTMSLIIEHLFPCGLPVSYTHLTLPTILLV